MKKYIVICLMSIQCAVMVGMQAEMLLLHNQSNISNQGKKRESVSRVLVLQRNHQKSTTESKDPVVEEKKQLKKSLSKNFGDYLANSDDFNISEQGCSPDIRRSSDRAVFF